MANRVSCGIKLIFLQRISPDSNGSSVGTNHSSFGLTQMKSQSSRIVVAGVVLLVALMALLADGAARRESVTFDEVAHIGAGVSYLQKLDMRMNEEHPPLAKVLAAVPLVLRGVHADYSSVSWTFSGSGIFKQILGNGFLASG